MGKPTRIAITAIRLVNGVINLGIVVAILLLLGFGTYTMWDAEQVYAQADSTRYDAYNPTADPEGKSFAELQQINREVFAWLTVYGTNIDYPVTQSRDHADKYINTSAEGTYSLSGAIFLDSKNRPDFSDFSNIIYGHHMEKQKMFGEIELFTDQSYFDARRYGSLYYGGREHGLEFFAFLHADAYDNSIYRVGITDPDEADTYLHYLLKRALHVRSGVAVTADDHIVLLSTCSNATTNGRDILIGRITSDVIADPFPDNESTRTTPVISKLPGLWQQAPQWLQITLCCVPLWLIALLIVLTYKKRQKLKEQPNTTDEE